MEKDFIDEDIRDMYGMDFTLKIAEEVSQGKKIIYPELKKSIDDYNREHGTRIETDHVLVCSILTDCQKLTEQIYDPVVAELRESAKRCKDKGIAEVINIQIGIIEKLKKESHPGKLQ